jgi:hypothetical protein
MVYYAHQSVNINGAYFDSDFDFNFDFGTKEFIYTNSI